MMNKLLKTLIGCSIYLSAILVPNTLLASVDLKCALSDAKAGKEKIVSKSEFSVDTPMVYLYCDSKQIQEGQTVTVQWIAVDTKKVAPDNYMITEKKVLIPKRKDPAEVVTIEVTLSKPNNGWPVGSYSTDIFLDKDREPAKMIPFTIGK